MYKTLIIEDEKEIREELCFLLENEGYSVDIIEKFENIEEQVKNVSPNLILLDVGLPNINGYELCIKIRKETKSPIIFVTSRNTSQDVLTALSVGGDFAMTKDKGTTPPTHTIFFKGKDTAAITAAFKDFVQREEKKIAKNKGKSITKELTKLKRGISEKGASLGKDISKDISKHSRGELSL